MDQHSSAAVECTVRPGDPRRVEGENCTLTRRTNHAHPVHMESRHAKDFDFAEVGLQYSVVEGQY